MGTAGHGPTNPSPSRGAVPPVPEQTGNVWCGVSQGGTWVCCLPRVTCRREGFRGSLHGAGAWGRLGGACGGDTRRMVGETRQKEERKQRKCFPCRHPHCLFPVRVSPESSGLVNLISCQNSHDNESWPAGWHSSFGTAAVEIAQLIYEQEIVLRWHQQAAQPGRGAVPTSEWRLWLSPVLLSAQPCRSRGSEPHGWLAHVYLVCCKPGFS